MSQHRMDYLVADHQSRLMNEAAEQRLAGVARAGRSGTGSAGVHHRPDRLTRWLQWLTEPMHPGTRHQRPRLHPR